MVEIRGLLFVLVWCSYVCFVHSYKKTAFASGGVQLDTELLLEQMLAIVIMGTLLVGFALWCKRRIVMNESKWISIKEQEPPDDTYALYYMEGKDGGKPHVQVMFKRKDSNPIGVIFGITHWMPLPEPPSKPKIARLEFELPESCGDCQLCQYQGGGIYMCYGFRNLMQLHERYKRAELCPLVVVEEGCAE